jgi:hypothetical protein
MPAGPMQVGDLSLDSNEFRGERGKRRIDLSAKEFALLEYVMRNSGQTVTRAIIMENVWNMPFDATTNLVDGYVKICARQSRWPVVAHSPSPQGSGRWVRIGRKLAISMRNARPTSQSNEKFIRALPTSPHRMAQPLSIVKATLEPALLSPTNTL